MKWSLKLLVPMTLMNYYCHGELEEQGPIPWHEAGLGG